MANIVDRLITYVEYRGIHNVIQSLTTMTRILEGTARGFYSLAVSTTAIKDLLLSKAFMIGAAGLAALAVGAVKASSEFEVMQAQLTGLYRSSAEGTIAFGFLRKFSQSSGPFSLSENVKNYVRLLSEGVSPSQKHLLTTQAVGFTRGMDPSQIAAIIGRAGLGNTRGLRQLGVGTADIEAVNKALVDSKGHFKNFGEAVNVIFDLLEKRYGEAIQEMNDLTVTKVSRLKSSFEGLLDAVGGLGISRVFKWLVDGLNFLVISVVRVIGSIESMALTLVAALLVIPAGLEAIIRRMFNIQKLMPFGDMVVNLINKANQIADYFGLSKKGGEGGVPPWLRHEDSQGGSAQHIIRELLGGGAIARIGIRASELPGIGVKRNNVIKVHVSGAGDQDLKRWLEKLLGEYHNQAIKHGVLPA